MDETCHTTARPCTLFLNNWIDTQDRVSYKIHNATQHQKSTRTKRTVHSSIVNYTSTCNFSLNLLSLFSTLLYLLLPVTETTVTNQVGSMVSLQRSICKRIDDPSSLRHSDSSSFMLKTITSDADSSFMFTLGATHNLHRGHICNMQHPNMQQQIVHWMPCYFRRIIRLCRIWCGRYGTILQRHICERRYLSSNHLGMCLRRIHASFKTLLRRITHFPSPLLRKPYCT